MEVANLVLFFFCRHPKTFVMSKMQKRVNLLHKWYVSCFVIINIIIIMITCFFFVFSVLFFYIYIFIYYYNYKELLEKEIITTF